MYIIVGLIFGVIWGVVCNVIIENKGHEGSVGWFLCGFFLGILGIIIAAVYPEAHPYTYSEEPRGLNYGSIASSNITSADEWRCAFCNRINPNYTGTCACGRSHVETKRKNDNAAKLLNEKYQENAKKEALQSENLKLDTLKKYKELLDDGVITQEEFDKKKHEIIN